MRSSSRLCAAAQHAGGQGEAGGHLKQGRGACCKLEHRQRRQPDAAKEPQAAYRQMPCCRCCRALPSRAGFPRLRCCHHRRRQWKAAPLRGPTLPPPQPGTPPAAALSTCFLQALPRALHSHKVAAGGRQQRRCHCGARTAGAGARRQPGRPGIDTLYRAALHLTAASSLWLPQLHR